MGDKVVQEFYCNKSGGGCGGYIYVKLHMALNHRVTVVCPKCGHRHERYIVDGEIHDNHSYKGGAGRYEEELIVSMAAYSAAPRTKLFHKTHVDKSVQYDSRNAAVIKSTADLKV